MIPMLKAYYHEHLFCSSWLAIAMFQEDYYNLLSIIGDDYEWLTLQHLMESSRFIRGSVRITCGWSWLTGLANMNSSITFFL